VSDMVEMTKKRILFVDDDPGVLGGLQNLLRKQRKVWEEVAATQKKLSDNVGAADTNQRLSRARADAVTRYLVSKGFDRNKFEVVGNGPDKPVASNDTDDGRAKNRRTDFEVIPR